MAAAVVLSWPAHAACLTPAGQAGTLQFNADAGEMQYCNGSSWVKFPRSAPATRWKQISAGKDWASPFTCAIANDDSGWCWGTDTNGRLGNGAAITAMQTTPSPIAGGYRWKQISAGFYHACGIRTDDVAMCWGEGNNPGVLGNGVSWGADQPEPVVVSGGHSWSRISAGAASCGVRTDGVAMCWGSDGNGRLGNGAGGDSNVPGIVSGGYTWADISSGLDHTCGVTTSGAGYCWGDATLGRLGNGTTTPSMQTPSLVNGGHTWRSIWASGYQSTCGLTTAGAAYCWGEAAGGKLGNGTTTPDQSAPVLVLGGHTFQEVQSGTNANCGLTTGNALYCWGDNSWESTGTGAGRTSPFIVSGGHSWSGMTIGGSVGCGVRTDGEAMCWGRADTGALGNSITNPNTSAVPVMVGDPSATCAVGTWTPRTAAAVATWQAVTYGNGQYVAVADSGTDQVMTSPDGITWTARTAAAANQWEAIAYGNGLFVALADTGTLADRVMTSPDGITWTARTSPALKNWESIAYGNGVFVAVSGSSAPDNVMTSPDGITWTARTAAQPNTWQGVAFGAGLFVAVSSDGTNQVMTSPDGITWTARNATQANLWNDVIYGNGLFVAVAGNGTNQVMTSPDGINWTARNAAGVAQWFSLAYGGGKFVAVAPGGINRTMYSHDGITWISPTAVASNNWVNVVYGDSGFVAVSDNGASQVITLACTVSCRTPTGTAGTMIYNSTSRVVQWCDGSTWHAAGPIGPTGPNSGCSTPAGTGGDVLFNSTACVLQYCDGDTWRSVGATPSAMAGATFDGGDWLKRGGGITGAADSKMITLSFWFRSTNAGIWQRILSSPASADGFLITLDDMGQLRFGFKDTSAANNLNLQVETLVADGAWHHVMLSVNANTTTAQLYVDGVSAGTLYTLFDATFDFTHTNWGVGVDPQNNWNPFNGDLADLWVDFGTYIDLSVPANRAKFYNNGPVNLGATGNGPTGSAPEIFLSGTVPGWHTNKGTGGGFTMTGTLTSSTASMCAAP